MAIGNEEGFREFGKVVVYMNLFFLSNKKEGETIRKELIRRGVRSHLVTPVRQQLDACRVGL